MNYKIDWEKLTLNEANEIASELCRLYYLKGFISIGDDYAVGNVSDLKVEDSVENVRLACLRSEEAVV